MKPEKLRKLQKKYKPEVCLNLKGDKCVLSDRLYIPNEFIDDEMMEEYTSQLGIIEIEKDEFGDEVEVEKEIRGYKEYPNVTAFHRGDIGKMDKTFLSKLHKSGVKTLDIRARPKMINDIEFTGELREDQKRVQKEWLEYEYGIIKAPPRYGKCIVGSSLVSTSQGLCYIEDICHNIPEEEMSIYNTPTILNRFGISEKATHRYRGKSSITYKFRTYCGYSEEGTPEHPLLVLTPSMKMIWKRLDNLKVGDRVAISTKGLFPYKLVDLPNSNSHSKLPKQCTKQLARLLGYLVAEGGLGYYPRWRFTNKNLMFIRSFRKLFIKCFPGTNMVFSEPKSNGVIEIEGHSKELTDFFDAIGLKQGNSYYKEIPWCILQSPKEIIREFLRGYFEGDGWNDHCGIQCCSKSPKLIKELQILLLSFGIVSKRRSKMVILKGWSEPKKYWNLIVSNQYANLFMKDIGFLSKRKNKAYNRIRNKEFGNHIPGSYSYLYNEVLSKSTGSGIYIVKGQRKVLKINPTNKSCDFKLSHLTEDILKNIKKISLVCYERFKELEDHSHIIWEEVVFYKKSNKLKKVYDLTVPNSHSFVANGIVNHNTVLLCSLLCKLHTKTLVVVHQNELIKQFRKALKNFTNAYDFEDGVSIIRANNIEDMETHDICMVTWQLLNSKNGKKALRKYRNAFGLVIVDECFPYETPVLIDYNKSLPIGDIINNKSITHVLSYDLENKKIVKRKIVRRITKEYQGWMIDVFIGQNRVQCSPNHKFILKGGKEVKAEDLDVGNILISYDDYFSQSYSCEICGELFDSVQFLTMHNYKEHQQDDNHTVKCDICGDKVNKFSIGFHRKMHDKKFNEVFSDKIGKKRIRYLKTDKGKKDIENLKNNRLGKDNPLFKNKTKEEQKDIRKRISKGQKQWFKSLSEKEFDRRVSIFMKAPNYNNHPNVCEKNIINLKIRNLKFTGDGKYFVSFKNRKKNPDFIATDSLSKNGRTCKVIEVMDFEYWHNHKEANHIKKQYKTLGIQCLIIDAKRCYTKKDLQDVKSEIEAFINNHNVKITRIEKTLVKKPKLLYNLEIQGTHNYFVVSDKVRNIRQREKLGWKPCGHRQQNVPYDNENFNRIPLLVSNCHKTAAPCFKSVVSKLNAYYRCGCTATDKRKDMMEPIVYDIIGPVVTKGKMKKVPLNVYIHKTEFDPKLSGNFMWCTLEKRLGSSKSRNSMICKHIKKDMEESRFHYGIVMTRPVFHVKLLVKKLNRMGIETAGFWGSAPNREKLLEDMVEGKYKVIVANRAMLLGINVPRWTHAYNVMPSANAPNFYQEMSRVRTPYKIAWKSKKTGETKTWKKKLAFIRDYVDDFGATYGCLNVRRGVYNKEKKIHICSTENGVGTEEPKCGACKNFNKCVYQGKDIKINTHACLRYSVKTKRFI